MNLNLLRIFDAVATTGSVNLAAELLDMTSPAVSQALSKLREQYQDPLFIRQGRGIILTNFALELHAEIQPPLKLLLNSVQSKQAFSARTSQRTFRLSSHTDIDQMLVPFLHVYKDKHAPQCKHSHQS